MRRFSIASTIYLSVRTCFKARSMTLRLIILQPSSKFSLLVTWAISSNSSSLSWTAAKNSYCFCLFEISPSAWTCLANCYLSASEGPAFIQTILIALIKWFVSEILNGSLHVTSASDPARFCTIWSAASVTRSIEPSHAKSFITSCLVVTRAIVTDLSTTGGKMSTIETLTAFLTACCTFASWTANFLYKASMSSGETLGFSNAKKLSILG